MNWKLALVAFALAPVLAAAAACTSASARAGSYREVRIRLARLNAYLQESLTGMTVIQLFAREASERETFGRLNEDLRRAQFRSTFYDASFYAMVETMGSAAVALVLWYGGGEILRGRLDLRGLVAFLEYTGPRLPAAARPRQQVHRDAGGHGVGRAHLRPARHARPPSPTLGARPGCRPGSGRDAGHRVP